MKKKRIGGAFGILCLLIGAVILAGQFALQRSSSVILAIFLSGPAFLLLGVSLLFFQGAEVTVPVDSAHAKDWYVNAPSLHRVVWATAAVVGVVIGYLIFQFA